MKSVVAAILLMAWQALAVPVYVCKKANEAVVIDGVLDEMVWASVDTAKLKNVETGATPVDKTHAFAVWDSTNLYIAFITEDSKVEGTITQHDGDLWTEEPVEFFLDPDGDSLNYMELQWNCINTSLDYFWASMRRGLNPFWTVTGMQSAVTVLGTANNSGDIDTGMVVEVAIPWGPLDTGSSVSLPPADGDSIRANFYRYQRHGPIEPAQVEYTAWSPTGQIDFHLPGQFGVLAFTNDGAVGVTQMARKSYLAAPWELSVFPQTDNTHRITFRLQTRLSPGLAIYNSFGQKVITLHNTRMGPDEFTSIWNGHDWRGKAVEHGIYFLRLAIDSRVQGIRILK